MRALFKDNIIEALVGLVVVLVAIGFVTFAYGRTQAGSGEAGYTLVARFPNVAGITAGTDVKVAGIKVGRVVRQSLDPVSYQAIVEFGIDKALEAADRFERSDHQRRPAWRQFRLADARRRFGDAETR